MYSASDLLSQSSQTTLCMLRAKELCLCLPKKCWCLNGIRNQKCWPSSQLHSLITIYCASAKRASDNQGQLKITYTILAARTSRKILYKSHALVKLYDHCNVIVTELVKTMDKTLVQYLHNGSTTNE